MLQIGIWVRGRSTFDSLASQEEALKNTSTSSVAWENIFSVKADLSK